MPAASTTSENENPWAVGRFRSPHQLCGTLCHLRFSRHLRWLCFVNEWRLIYFRNHSLMSYSDEYVSVDLAITFVILDTLNIFLIDWLIDWLKTPACRVSRLRCRFSGLNELVAENLISSLVINEEQYKQTRQLHNCDATVFNSLVNCSLRQLVQSQITLSASLS